MMPPGHLAATYLIATPFRVSNKQLSIALIAGLILDLDVLIAPFVGIGIGSHHLLPTHTPIFIIIALLVIRLIKPLLSRITIILIGIAALTHLVLDDIGYWFQLLGWQKQSQIPQIFWFYPFDARRNQVLYTAPQSSAQTAINQYLSQAPINIILELILIIIAVIVYLHQMQKQGTIATNQLKSSYRK